MRYGNLKLLYKTSYGKAHDARHIIRKSSGHMTDKGLIYRVHKAFLPITGEKTAHRRMRKGWELVRNKNQKSSGCGDEENVHAYQSQGKGKGREQ